MTVTGEHNLRPISEEEAWARVAEENYRIGYEAGVAARLDPPEDVLALAKELYNEERIPGKDVSWVNLPAEKSRTYLARASWKLREEAARLSR